MLKHVRSLSEAIASICWSCLSADPTDGMTRVFFFGALLVHPVTLLISTLWVWLIIVLSTLSEL